MKKHFLLYAVSIALIWGFYASANRVSAQIAGAYADTSATSKEVKRAARFAVQRHGLRTDNKVTLVSVIKAESQVVAGLNYRLVLRVSNRRRHRSTVTVVVYQDLKNKLSLTSWEASDAR